MKKASVKVQDVTNNRTPIEKSCISLNYNNEKQDNLNNQVNLNIIKFVQNNLNKKLMKTLYQDPQTKSISNEYKNNLIYYYVFLLTYLLSLGAFALLLHNMNYLSNFHLEIHMICLSIIAFISILTLILIFKSEKVLLNSRNAFLIITSCLNFYLILADERILHKLTGEDLGEKQLPLSLGLICTIVLSRIILFDYFFYIFILGASTLIMFFSSHLALSGYSSYSIFSEASLITLFITLQIMECYRADFRIKQIFYRREQEAVEDTSKLIKKDSLPVPGINTEVENILVKCNKIAKNLKNISQVVIYKDIKRLLKKSLTNTDKIKRKVAHGGFETGRVELSPAIDDDDRIYITQNFLGLNSTNNILQQGSLSDLSERIISFPFSRYGVNELESILAGVGKNWSFDIFFVYESTGHSISMVSKYLLQKWNFFGSFLYVSKKDSEKGKISEELATKYFLELENV